ncbi:MAG: hypothetical protein ACJA1D_000172 [Polaribacter sp.]|jgi:hypothetical protein
MNKIFNWLTGDLFTKVGDSIDKLITSDEEKLILRNELQKLFYAQNLELAKLNFEIISAEAKGNFLQRSWRPILMLSFGFVVLYSKFIALAFNLPNAPLEPDFFMLLKLGIGGYGVLRSAEKIVKTLKNKK